MGGGRLILSSLFSELFSQPKLDIFRGVEEYGPGDTKTVEIPLNEEIWLHLQSKKKNPTNLLFLLFLQMERGYRIGPPPSNIRVKHPIKSKVLRSQGAAACCETSTGMTESLPTGWRPGIFIYPPVDRIPLPHQKMFLVFKKIVICWFACISLLHPST